MFIYESIQDALITAVVFMLMYHFWRKIKKKKIWIIEDSSIDIDLFRLRLKLDPEQFDVQYLTSATMLAQKMLKLQKPDAVLVDYFLGNSVKGDKVVAFCDNNSIPSILVTGYDGEIAGMRERIIRKTNDDSFYRAVETWVKKVTQHV